MPDALLYPEIWEVEAPFSVGVATWGGISQSIIGGGGYSGDVLAASLFVAIQDTLGNELYTREAGIQVLESLFRGELNRLAPEQLFSDSTWIPSAVTRALGPSARGTAGRRHQNNDETAGRVRQCFGVHGCGCMCLARSGGSAPTDISRQSA